MWRLNCEREEKESDTSEPWSVSTCPESATFHVTGFYVLPRSCWRRGCFIFHIGVQLGRRALSIYLLTVFNIQRSARLIIYPPLHLSSTALTVKVMVSGSRDFSCWGFSVATCWAIIVCFGINESYLIPSATNDASNDSIVITCLLALIWTCTRVCSGLAPRGQSNSLRLHWVDPLARFKSRLTWTFSFVTRHEVPTRSPGPYLRYNIPDLCCTRLSRGDCQKLVQRSTSPSVYRRRWTSLENGGRGIWTEAQRRQFCDEPISSSLRSAYFCSSLT